MKIYIMDCKWRGSIVVIADTLEEAHTYMESEYNYDINNPVEVKEIKKGLIHTDLGDC